LHSSFAVEYFCTHDQVNSNFKEDQSVLRNVRSIFSFAVEKNGVERHPSPGTERTGARTVWGKKMRGEESLPTNLEPLADQTNAL
jgi:hypothetical protein